MLGEREGADNCSNDSGNDQRNHVQWPEQQKHQDPAPQRQVIDSEGPSHGTSSKRSAGVVIDGQRRELVTDGIGLCLLSAPACSTQKGVFQSHVHVMRTFS
jgi:hypothetical protein